MVSALSEEDVERLVQAVRADPNRRGELVELLHEAAPLYAGRGANSTALIRARIISTFADVGLPDSAAPFIEEELQSGNDPALVAAAARAATGRPIGPDTARLLAGALWRIVPHNDVVTFEATRPVWPPARPTTPVHEILTSLRLATVDTATVDALHAFARGYASLLSTALAAELAETMAALRPAAAATCCGRTAPTTLTPVIPYGAGNSIGAGIELEDQDGVRVPFDYFFGQAPTLTAFFYTRCTNPNKCSLTITNLALMQRELARSRLAGTIQLAAITYDPGYDSPGRMSRYGRDRGMEFGPGVRLFRATAGQDLLRRRFELRVGYIDTVVNRHAIELFLVRGGQIAHIWARQRWQPAEVLATARDLTARRAG